MALCLGVRDGERVRVRIGGKTLWLTVVGQRGSTTRLAFDAPREVEILREAVAARATRRRRVPVSPLARGGTRPCG